MRESTLSYPKKLNSERKCKVQLIQTQINKLTSSINAEESFEETKKLTYLMFIAKRQKKHIYHYQIVVEAGHTSPEFPSSSSCQPVATLGTSKEVSHHLLL